MQTLTYSGQLTVVSCWCGTRHAVPEELRDFQMRRFEGGKSMEPIYCPLGHKHYPAGEPKIHKLERQLQRERQSHDQTRADRDHKEKQRRAEKGAKTRLQNRAANGVCPCCNRSFKDLHRHMKSKHPEFGGEK